MAVPWDVITAEATPFDREHVLQQRTHSTETRGRPVGRHHGGSDPIQPRMPAAHHSKLADSRTSPHLQDLQNLCVCVCVYVYIIHTCARADTHTHLYITHTHTQTHAHTHTHTHTHTHLQDLQHLGYHWPWSVLAFVTPLHPPRSPARRPLCVCRVCVCSVMRVCASECTSLCESLCTCVCDVCVCVCARTHTHTHSHA